MRKLAARLAMNRFTARGRDTDRTPYGPLGTCTTGRHARGYRHDRYRNDVLVRLISRVGLAIVFGENVITEIRRLADADPRATPAMHQVP